MFSADAGRRFRPSDLVLAQEVARRAALAVDNARLYSEAQAAVRARDEFLSIASHELRTPLTGLKGVAQLLIREEERGQLTPDKLRRFLPVIVDSSNRLGELTDDLLDVSRLRTGHLDLRTERVDLASIVRRVVEQHEHLLTGRHPLSLELEQSCHVVADVARLEQVFANLLVNAVKYSPDGGAIKVYLVTDGDPDGAVVHLRVQDAGIGLPAGTEERVFEPFGRAPNATLRQIPGMGLGLHIARGIVERHGGRIWAESLGEGQGTTLHIVLPCAPARDDPAPD
jgi:signal transduction histidine kinase